jgi:SAM-dependent methyltransferase
VLTFTGERVIPGTVEPDLWNEHVSRYYLARKFARDQHTLDIGCGAGYGTNLVGAVAEQSLGIDVSLEAIQYASSRAEHGVCFCVASADAVPAADSTFGLITAFEVIEHISNWQGLISEAARTLTPEGVFLVSTPNKVYYAETRQSAGPNPFHVHEFELAEFQSELRNCFSHVAVLAQNHQEVLTFAGENSNGTLEGHLSSSPELADSHFFVAVCSNKPVKTSAFLYAASGSNLLKERETYINILKKEVNSLTEQSDSQVRELNLLRTRLSDSLEQINKLQGERRIAAQSKWLRLGRRLGLGPKLQ